jgi:Na+/serine symporter
MIRLKKSPRVAGACQLFLGLCRELCDLTNEIISWIIDIAPFCIGFLVAASLATAGTTLRAFSL